MLKHTFYCFRQSDIYWAPIHYKVLGRVAISIRSANYLKLVKGYQKHEWKTQSLSLYVYEIDMLLLNQTVHVLNDDISVCVLHCPSKWLAFNRSPRKAYLLLNFYLKKKVYNILNCIHTRKLNWRLRRNNLWSERPWEASFLLWHKILHIRSRWLW